MLPFFQAFDPEGLPRTPEGAADTQSNASPVVFSRAVVAWLGRAKTRQLEPRFASCPPFFPPAS